jgi:hypothetical protein
MDPVKECEGIRKYALLGWTAGTSAITGIVEQVNCTGGKCNGKTWHVKRNILRISPEVDEGI